MPTRSNAFEQEVIDSLIEQGCEVLTRGWPDLLVKNKKGRVFALELKAPKDNLSHAQMEMHHALHNWTPLCVITRRYADVEGLADTEDVGLGRLEICRRRYSSRATKPATSRGRKMPDGSSSETDRKPPL